MLHYSRVLSKVTLKSSILQLQYNDTEDLQIMSNAKNVLKSLLLTVTLGLFSTLAFAEGGLPDVENVCKKLKEASAAIASGQSAENVAELAKTAKSLTKDIIVSDVVSIKKEKSTGVIKEAIAAIKAGDMKKADELLKQADKEFDAFKKLL